MLSLRFSEKKELHSKLNHGCYSWLVTIHDEGKNFDQLSRVRDSLLFLSSIVFVMLKATNKNLSRNKKHEEP